MECLFGGLCWVGWWEWFLRGCGGVGGEWCGVVGGVGGLEGFVDGGLWGCGGVGLGGG